MVNINSGWRRVLLAKAATSRSPAGADLGTRPSILQRTI
jgi:hypothetical protein